MAHMTYIRRHWITAQTTTTFLLLCLMYTAVAGDKHALNDYISHYEGLTYDTSAVQRSHSRVRRSVDSHVNIQFSSHGRKFNLQLRHDESTFVSQPEEILSDRSVRPLDTSHIYQGHLEGEPQSYVHGSIINGVFAGRIDMPTETFYVDKSETYFMEKKPFHSVIYSSTDVASELPSRVKRSTDDSGSACGLSKSDIHSWMETVQNSAVDTSTPVSRQRREYSSNYEEFLRRYTNGRGSNRYQRSTKSPRNRVCALFLQSDPMLWDYMTKPTTKGGLGYKDDRAREEITALFANHVDGVKKIYVNTTFLYDTLGPYEGFTFAVRRIQINTTHDCNNSNTDNPFCKANIDVSNFLNLNSLTDHDLYCLAYVFTFRDFSQGTLGLAWVGSSLKASGGLCERWKEYNENNRRVFKSLNTGIVTLVNYGSRVPPKVSTLTFAHEIGHNFGSPHDSGPQCVPLLTNGNDPYGNFIMYASATSGDRLNNHKFSMCSIGNMSLVLNAVLNELNGKVNCFEDSQEAFCGNRIVEGDEQCDCGFQSDCDEHGDNCCYPQQTVGKQCTRHENASCSPSEGPCCISATCQFVDKATGLLCLSASECSNAAYCSGSSARCPTPVPKENYTLCNFNTQVCRNGECTGSVCEKIGSGWSACSLSAPTDDKNFNRGQLCYVSCWNAATATCVSTGNSQDVNKPENKVLLDFLVLQTARDGIQLPPGAPCDNFKGYCDVFQKCRAVNEDGPLARLKNLLFNQQTFNDIKAWITEHWWAVLLMSLALVVFMALFIKICAVHTPSSNPKQPPARKLTLPRRHAHRPQGQNQPPPYSSAQPIQLQSMPAGGPPHGKRRGGRPPASSSSQAAQSSGQARHFTDVGMAGGGKRGGGHGHRQMQQV